MCMLKKIYLLHTRDRKVAFFCLALCAVIPNWDESKISRYYCTSVWHCCFFLRSGDGSLVLGCTLRKGSILVANKVKRNWIFFLISKVLPQFWCLCLSSVGTRRFKGLPAYGKHCCYQVWYLCLFLDGRTLISSGCQCVQPNTPFFGLFSCSRWPCDMLISEVTVGFFCFPGNRRQKQWKPALTPYSNLGMDAMAGASAAIS